jgi:hypothetical protein
MRRSTDEQVGDGRMANVGLADQIIPWHEGCG